MPALITELINKLDSSEIIRDQIAGILKLESAAQEVLATAAHLDPRLWRLRVFTERSNPWSEFENAPAQLEGLPIVNVSYEGSSFDAAASNLVKTQRAIGTFNIDCYGYGVAAETDTGQVAGDEKAAFEAQRAVRLVRNILMSAHYMYLGLPRGADQFVSKRWPQAVTAFNPSIDGAVVQQIVGARLALQVEFNEHSPQWTPVVGLELVFATVKRAENGEIYLQARYGE